MKFSRNLTFHTRRDAWVEVNLGAIEHNATQVRGFLPESVSVMAVVKADAYGHGTGMVVPTLEASGISMVGVAAMDEALQVRQAGLTLPTLVLGATPDWAMQYAIENDVQMTVFSQQHLDSLARLYDAAHGPIAVQIKVNTGMHRIGVDWTQAADFVRQCQGLPHLSVQGVFSHLASTHDRAFTQTQLSRWNDVLTQLDPLPQWRHIANSGGTWHYPLGNNTMVRVGIALFGYAGEDIPLPVTLKPAMGVKARIVHLHDLPPGEGVSYNQIYQNTGSTPRRIATLPLGYADGIPRALSNRIVGLYRGIRVPQVGQISMDQLMVDVTDAPEACVGDVVTLIGESHGQRLTLTDWSLPLGTIEYELMCALRVRLPKTYVR